MSALAKLVKDTTNCVLLTGFFTCPRSTSSRKLCGITSRTSNGYQLLSLLVPNKQCLGEVMLQYQKKVHQMLKNQWHSCLTHSCSARQKPLSAPVVSGAPVEGSVEGQFHDLGQDPYDPLKTPTDTQYKTKVLRQSKTTLLVT